MITEHAKLAFSSSGCSDVMAIQTGYFYCQSGASKGHQCSNWGKTLRPRLFCSHFYSLLGSNFKMKIQGNLLSFVAALPQILLARGFFQEVLIRLTKCVQQTLFNQLVYVLGFP